MSNHEEKVIATSKGKLRRRRRKGTAFEVGVAHAVEAAGSVHPGADLLGGGGAKAEDCH